MRITNRHSRVVLSARPFQNGPGASLYVGTPDGPAIRYRRNVSVTRGSAWRTVSQATIHPGAAGSVPKCQRVGSVASPTAVIAYTLPAALLGVNVASQIRTYQGDYENETIYAPVISGVSGGGAPADTILGTALVLSVQKRDAGGALVQFAYTATPNGIQPATFTMHKTSGAGTIADVSISAGSRVNSIEVDGLTDGVTYGFFLLAVNGAVSVTLATINFTADATGPSDPIGLVAVPY